MRKLLFVASVILLFPAVAVAQSPGAPSSPPAAVPDVPSLSESVPMPMSDGKLDGYQVAAISVGAIAGVVVANAVTGGLITPIIMVGANGAGVTIHGAGWMAVKTGVTVAGAVAGGYVGNWLYQN